MRRNKVYACLSRLTDFRNMCASVIHDLLGINIVKNGTQEGGMPKSQPMQTKKRTQSFVKKALDNSRKLPTSVGLTQEEREALKVMAKRRNRSPSALMREGVRLVLGASPESGPSIGIVDGVFSSTVTDDLVTLANQLVALGYVISILDQHLTRRRREHARLLLRDTVGSLEKIAGAFRC